MEQSSFQDEQTVRHQFDYLCKLALKSEVVNYEKHMAYRQKHEVMLSELSEKELSRLFIMDEHEMETHRFQVLGYDIEVKDCLGWIVFWKEDSIRKSLYLSIIPSLLFIESGIISGNILLLIFAVIFAPCHILISYMNAVLI